jgi:hypothetical protein
MTLGTEPQAPPCCVENLEATPTTILAAIRRTGHAVAAPAMEAINDGEGGLSSPGPQQKRFAAHMEARPKPRGMPIGTRR